MSSERATYAIGIDLGTTHCALASLKTVSPQAGAPNAATTKTPAPGAAVPQHFPVLQVVAAGETSRQPLLPSFAYLAAEGEFAEHALALPWSTTASNTTQPVIGSFARSKGATTAARLIASAKSWLSHTKVDRHAAILPWGAPEGVAKLSPVAASAAYLEHLRRAWDAEHPEAPLAEQDVVLTVPASFDAVARELTLEAAALAGFTHAPRLLEEPQAALYDWVAQSQGEWRQQVQVGDRILVVDIGGGTTDFSLIAVAERDGALELERLFVGNHILLGGDNMDLALAYGVRARLEAEGKPLDEWQMVALTHACRVAKEKLLSDEAPATCPLVIPGRSSRLIGGSISSELTRAQLDELLLEGFLPQVNAQARPQNPPRTGLTTLGLPYASDAAITRHLAAFLQRAAQRVDGASATASDNFPSKVLFNGGVTRSPVVRERLLGVLAAWAGELGKTAPSALRGTDAELAVSRGAAYFARAAKQGDLLRIKSATVHSHYVGIARAELAVPGLPPRTIAVCVAPCGMEEGSEVSLEQSFGLVLGELVTFRFFASGTRPQDVVGSMVEPAELSELPPLETTLGTAAAGEDEEIVEVRLQARLSEIGTLELAAVDVASERRWKLSFNLRPE